MLIFKVFQTSCSVLDEMNNVCDDDDDDSNYESYGDNDAHGHNDYFYDDAAVVDKTINT